MIQAAKSNMLDTNFSDISNESSLKIMMSAQDVSVFLRFRY